MILVTAFLLLGMALATIGLPVSLSLPVLDHQGVHRQTLMQPIPFHTDLLKIPPPQQQNRLPAPKGFDFDGPDPGLNADLFSTVKGCPNNYREDQAKNCRPLGYDVIPAFTVTNGNFRGDFRAYIGVGRRQRGRRPKRPRRPGRRKRPVGPSRRRPSPAPAPGFSRLLPGRPSNPENIPATRGESSNLRNLPGNQGGNPLVPSSVVPTSFSVVDSAAVVPIDGSGAAVVPIEGTASVVPIDGTIVSKDDSTKLIPKVSAPETPKVAETPTVDLVPTATKSPKKDDSKKDDCDD